MRVHLTANAFRQQNDMVRIVFYRNYSGEGIGDFGGAKNGGKGPPSSEAISKWPLPKFHLVRGSCGLSQGQEV